MCVPLEVVLVMIEELLLLLLLLLLLFLFLFLCSQPPCVSELNVLTQKIKHFSPQKRRAPVDPRYHVP